MLRRECSRRVSPDLTAFVHSEKLVKTYEKSSFRIIVLFIFFR